MKRDEKNQIYHLARTTFGPGDDFCVVWPLFDLLPTGSSDYRPKRKINQRSPYQLTNNIAIQVRDYPQALAFYQNVLGMRLEAANETEAKLSIGGTRFYLEQAQQAGNVYFEFAVNNLAEVKDSLLAEGCKITNEFNERSVMVKDPYGLQFHLFES